MFHIIIWYLWISNYLKCFIIDETLTLFAPSSVGKIIPIPFISNLKVNASKNAVGGSFQDNEDEINRPINISVSNIDEINTPGKSPPDALMPSLLV